MQKAVAPECIEVGNCQLRMQAVLTPVMGERQGLVPPGPLQLRGKSSLSF
jgi:hypothetical protein